MNNQIDIAVSILTSLLTGGFILFLIENQHIEKEVTERFYALMKPFYSSLTKYLRFLLFCKSFIQYDNKESKNIAELKRIMEELARLGSQTIINGQTIPIMAAKKIEQYCNDINNIWYFYSKPYTKDHIHFDNNTNLSQDIKEYLLVYSLKYKDNPINIDLLPKVSGDFFIEKWQPIQDITYQYEYWQKKCKQCNWFIFVSIILIILVLLIILFNPHINFIILSILTILCCIVFGFLIFKIVKLLNLSNRIIH